MTADIVYVTFRGHFSDSPRAVYEALLARGADATHTWLAAPHTRAWLDRVKARDSVSRALTLSRSGAPLRAWAPAPEINRWG